jgi:hypothetical protein
MRHAPLALWSNVQCDRRACVAIVQSRVESRGLRVVKGTLDGVLNSTRLLHLVDELACFGVCSQLVYHMSGSTTGDYVQATSGKSNTATTSHYPRA